MTRLYRLGTAIGLLGVVGCAKGRTYFPPITRVSAIDFRPHSADGFMFSPNAYTGPHRVIGMVTILVRAEARLPNDAQFTWQIGKVPVDSALANAKAAVIGLGGNALVNFTIRATTEAVGANLELPALEVSGLAIARDAPTPGSPQARE